MNTQHTPDTGIADARDRLRERAQNEATCIALNKMLRDVEQQRDELQTELLSLVRAIKCSSARGYISADMLARAEAIAKAGGKRDEQTTRQANNKSWRDPAEG